MNKLKKNNQNILIFILFENIKKNLIIKKLKMVKIKRKRIENKMKKNIWMIC